MWLCLQFCVFAREDENLFPHPLLILTGHKPILHKLSMKQQDPVRTNKQKKQCKKNLHGHCYPLSKLQSAFGDALSSSGKKPGTSILERQKTGGSSLGIVKHGSPNGPSLITEITLGMTAGKNKIRPMLMREISWIGKCEFEEAGGRGEGGGVGSSLGRCKNSGLTSAYSSYHRAGRPGERVSGKKGRKEGFKEV